MTKGTLTDEAVILPEEIAMARMVIEEAKEAGITEVAEANITTIVLALRKAIAKQGYVRRKHYRDRN